MVALQEYQEKLGSGKTTLANIITKLYEIENGKIKINDIDINDIDRKSFYNETKYVLQEDYIYDNTIKYNVELGKKYDQKDILESLQNAEFLDTVQIMPEKYNTHIGESGIKI